MVQLLVSKRFNVPYKLDAKLTLMLFQKLDFTILTEIVNFQAGLFKVLNVQLPNIYIYTMV